MTKTIAVAGSLAQKPQQGGHTWVFLQYLLGFRRLGWEVLFLDRLEPEMCSDEVGQPCDLEASVNLRYFLRVIEEFGLRDAFTLDYNGGERYIGLSRGEALERVSRSAFLLNVMGFLRDEELLARAPRRVFLDIDPGFGQMWRELGLHDPFQGHDTVVTIGENIGRSNCAIPTCELEWLTTRQPVVLDLWPCQDSAGVERFTSIGAWRGPNGPITYRGKTYGLRVHEFRKFVPLPCLSGQRFELALDIHPNETNDLEFLAANGWSLVDPLAVADTPFTYRSYVQDSKAEFMVAKNMYVDTRSGWFSDRSICYLASGRPVLAQDTGLQGLYPIGEGLLTFSTLDEALAGVEAISHDYGRHALAARALAEEYFDSDKVLGRLLDKLGVV
jgi:hypothetical protein